MTALSLDAAKDAIYASLHEDNEDIDIHIQNLKIAMKEEGVKEAVFDPTKLSQNNRQGRKMMQSYFKRKGVKVVFKES